MMSIKTDKGKSLRGRMTGLCLADSAAEEGKDEIQGSLHCAPNGEAVCRSGRDDVLLFLKVKR